MKVCQRCGHIYDDENDFCPQCNKKTKLCKECGFENAPDANFCVICGHRFPQKLICACGAKNDEDATFCYACGRTLKNDEPQEKHISGWKIALACAVVFLILAFICFYI